MEYTYVHVYVRVHREAHIHTGTCLDKLKIQ